ncbi:hypothetical protein N7509_012852 [Penicillium cosmopolitanum]|uniref:Major facilitator superfamily (MFS) profile domain-containing protein n=1 Tax=Penicillium cosmopolitanum TaxID=1131564 RepID=A0A9W9SC95_9EURO|nr:uncharacterized protein N7509_012852 [Penicillium cosmopolitanum]KAJ5375966.1 hypothetical protein N7509_012852 [Penicillium cosmopolitanum]
MCDDRSCTHCNEDAASDRLNTTTQPSNTSKVASKYNQPCFALNYEWQNEVATLKSVQDGSNLGPPPDGGIKAWLVAAGAACIFFSALGFANSFGVFVEYYLSHQLKGQSPDKVAWIGSVAVFTQFAAGADGGPLFDRCGAWVCKQHFFSSFFSIVPMVGRTANMNKVIRPSAGLLVFAIMMTSLCTQYWQFMLAQGILLGVSMGFLQFPAMAAVTQYFDKKAGTALGLVISGSSIGGVVIPIALSKMLNSTNLGFGWSIRIIGFLLIPLLSFSCITVRSRLPPRKSAFFLPSAFKDRTYCMVIAALFFMFIGMFAPLFYMPTYAVKRGMDATLASYLLAIVNGASTFERVVPGVLADKFGRLNVFMFGGMASGVVVCCMNQAKSTSALVVYAVIVGFTTGTIISGGTTAFTLCIKCRQQSGTLLGMGIGLSSISVLIGPPANGAFVQQYGGFAQMSIFSGVKCLVGGLIAFAVKSTTPHSLFGRT